ncbi:MAG: ATP-binding protein [Synergistaceae bacterium]|nr:ATP-binding protein [Synergistaceae bacterium]
MKKLPIGIQNFKKIITGNYVYVDKTQYIYNLINGASYYFLSRPRRFGKSLLLDTIGEVFGGDKELFRGLWIYDSDYDFTKHPVIRLDMSNIANDTPELLKDAIMLALGGRIQDEGFDIADGIPSHMFTRLIELLHKKYKQRVVVLIDEYDKPILDHITDIETSDANRQVLRGFYGILKSMDPYLKFTFITGVTKFTKTSIFSGLNNLKDITMLEAYADICGIPIGSLDEYFDEHIDRLSQDNDFKQYDSIYDEILNWYDGYSWDGATRLFNPYSLLNFIDDRKFMNYWYVSGTPLFLIDMIKKKPESFLALRNLKITEMMLDTFDIRKMEIEPLLFQTGYLTVKEVIKTRGSPIYRLDMPNFEVRDAFNLQILSGLTESGDVTTGQARFEIQEALEKGDLQKMLVILRSLFASIPYNLHVDLEAYYHSIFYATMTVLGFDMDIEVSVSRGRVDAVLDLEDKVYVMEFKYKKCPPDANEEDKRKLFQEALDEAMAQINDRGYAERYKGSGKAIYRVAFAFIGRDEIEMKNE